MSQNYPTEQNRELSWGEKHLSGLRGPLVLILGSGLIACFAVVGLGEYIQAKEEARSVKISQERTADADFDNSWVADFKSEELYPDTFKVKRRQ